MSGPRLPTVHAVGPAEQPIQSYGVPCAGAGLSFTRPEKHQSGGRSIVVAGVARRAWRPHRLMRNVGSGSPAHIRRRHRRVEGRNGGSLSSLVSSCRHEALQFLRPVLNYVDLRGNLFALLHHQEALAIWPYVIGDPRQRELVLQIRTQHRELRSRTTRLRRDSSPPGFGAAGAGQRPAPQT